MYRASQEAPALQDDVAGGPDGDRAGHDRDPGPEPGGSDEGSQRLEHARLVDRPRPAAAAAARGRARRRIGPCGSSGAAVAGFGQVAVVGRIGVRQSPSGARSSTARSRTRITTPNTTKAPTNAYSWPVPERTSERTPRPAQIA